jgi:negative regulator of sigma E activity
MADTKNTEVPPASEPPAPVEETAAPVTVVREKRNWATPLIAALVVVAALVIGGVGGYALAAVTHAGGRPAIQVGQLPGQGQQGPLQGPGQQGERPDRPNDDSTEQDSDDTTEQDSTEG